MQGESSSKPTQSASSRWKMRIYLWITLGAMIGLLGFAFESSYFWALDLNALDFLNIKHFILSGLIEVIPLIIGLIVWSLIVKFFTKGIHENDVKNFRIAAKKLSFNHEIDWARTIFVITFIYWIWMIFLQKTTAHLPGMLAISGVLIFFNLLSFVGTYSSSPKFSQLTITFMFFLSIAFCFSAAGYGEGLFAKQQKNTIRDDLIVNIVRVKSAIHTKAKPIKISTPALQILGLIKD